MSETIGIIAGEPPLPELSCRAARRQGWRTVVAAVKGAADPGLAAEADEWAEFPLGRLGALLRYFQARQVRRALMIGRVRHAAVFSPWKTDAAFVRFLAGVRDRTTTALLSALADFFAAEGVEIVDSSFFLREHLVAARSYTPRLRPGRAVRDDIEFAWGKAWGLAGLDIGQTVCVKGRAVVAVEAMEGTDAAIERAAAIAGPGLVVAKVSRPGQDMRFDLPVAGPRTLEVLGAARAAAFVLEAGRTLLLDPPAMAEQARRHGVILMGRT